MFVIIFIGIILYVAFHVKNTKGEMPEKLAKILNVPVDELASLYNKTETRMDRSSAMSREFGKPWIEFFPEEDGSDFVYPTVYGRMERRYYGVMDMNIAGDQVVIYDLWNSFPYEQEAQAIPQTVISIKPPKLNLPQFKIRPKSIFGKTASSAEMIKTDTILDIQFEIETMAPHRTKLLFQSELGTEVLIPFLIENRWTIEWTDDRFLVYKIRNLVEPHRIAEFALEVSEFFDLLKLGPDAIDGMMQEILESSKLTARR